MGPSSSSGALPEERLFDFTGWLLVEDGKPDGPRHENWRAQECGIIITIIPIIITIGIIVMTTYYYYYTKP